MPVIICGLNWSIRAKKSIVSDALRRTRFENAQQVIESLKQEVEAFRNGAEPNDDLTMMCLNVS